MRLALKFALSFLIVFLAIRAVSTYLRVDREVALFDADMRRDHVIMAEDLASAVSAIWNLGGEASARDFIEQASASKGHVDISLVTIGSPSDETAEWPDVLGPQLRDVSPGDLMHVVADTLGRHTLSSYLVLTVPDAGLHALRLVEPLDERDAYIDLTIRRAALWSLLTTVASGVVVMILGLVFIARPTRKLIDKARRVAMGDLTGRVELRQHDELGELARELTAMSDRLGEARQQVFEEAKARRIAIDQLRHADRLTTVGKLASAVAHELNSPLSVTKFMAGSIASREAQGEEAVEFGAVILRQANQMSGLTRKLLDLSRHQVSHRSSDDLLPIVRRTCDVVEPFARQHKVRLRRNFPGGSLLAVADSEQIGQVLSNLLMNAIDAMPEGGELTVAVERTRFKSPGANGSGLKGDYACIAISDTGVGILPELIDRVFDPFFTTKDRSKGTGLGLSISAEIVHEHGGWIGLKSESGLGTTFSVYLPLDQAYGVSRP